MLRDCKATVMAYEHELHSVIIWPPLVTVIEAMHTVLMRIVELHLKQKISFEVAKIAFGQNCSC